MWPLMRLRIALIVNRIGVIEHQTLPLIAGLGREAGHTVRLFEFTDPPSGLVSYAPHIVGYSVCSSETPAYLLYNRELKQRLRYFALFGGPDPTYRPTLIGEDGVDGILRGEGDLSFPLFLSRFGTDGIYETAGMSFKMPDGTVRENPLPDLVPDLDRLPFPARELVYDRSALHAENPLKSFMAGRGCPYDCGYCLNNAYNRMYRGKGSILRVKSVSYLLEEIGAISRRYSMSFVRFHDDVFGWDLDWLEELSRRFPTEVGLPFSCYVHPQMATPKRVDLLRRAGCHAACMAVECANERIRCEVLGRRVSNDAILEAAGRLKSAGIRLSTFNMVGLPGETEEDMLDTVRLNVRIGADFADATIFQPHPGTAARRYCVENGFLPAEDARHGGYYDTAPLRVSPDLEHRIFRVHKLFSFLVDHPRTVRLAGLFPNTGAARSALRLFSRGYFDQFLQQRIYGSVIPLRLRLAGAADLLFSRMRD